MHLFNQVKNLIEKLDHYPCIQVVSSNWFKGEFDIHWVDEDEQHYSAETFKGNLSREGCTIVNVDNGCGETITMVFLKEKELSEDDFYDKYEG